MGEGADLVMDGVICQSCGDLIDEEGCGFPANCASCQEE